MNQNETRLIDASEIYDNILSTEQVLTGDLFPTLPIDNSELTGVVLTPLCDLAQEKIEQVKLARAMQFQTYLEEIFVPQHLKSIEKYRELIEKDPKAFGKFYAGDPSKRDDNKTLGFVKDLQMLFENTKPLKDSYYYLPGNGKDKENRKKGFLVDFSHIFSIPLAILKNRRPLLRLRSPWREQLLNRYIAYSLRIGTQDYSKTSTLETIHAFFPELDKEKILNRMK